jgi:hypothetical protein
MCIEFPSRALLRSAVWNTPVRSTREVSKIVASLNMAPAVSRQTAAPRLPNRWATISFAISSSNGALLPHLRHLLQ